MSGFADYVDESGITRLRATGATASPLLTARVHVTSAEIIAMETTAKVIVPEPEASELLLPRAAVLQYRAGAVAYDYDPGLRVTWSSFQSYYIPEATTGVIDSLNDYTLTYSATPFGFVTDDADPTQSPRGQALVLTAPNVLFTPPLGDGTIDMTVYYLAVSLLPV